VLKPVAVLFILHSLISRDWFQVLFCISELCQQHSDDTLPEVDLVSLVKEQLPRYSLRADSVTDFTGYSNADWIVQTPCLNIDDDFSFSPEFIEETLNYFGNDDKIYQ